jgi:hypothetical protein
MSIGAFNDPTNELAFSQFPTYFGNAGSSTVSSLDNASSGLGSDALGSGGSSSNLIQQELQMLMQLIQLIEQQLQQQQSGGSGSGGDPSGPPSTNPAGNDQHYNTASGKSWGDPHQSFNGSQGSGNTSGSANNMQSQSDLLDANGSVRGGYQVSTQATPPDSNGITYNQSATVSTGNGNDTVTMGPGGQVTVNDDGNAVSLSKGQSVKLSSGATVTENQDGSVTVTDQSRRRHHHGVGAGDGDGDDGNSSAADANGSGNVSTTLSWNGKGVDVSFNASNIDLGGYLPSLGQTQAQPQGFVG